MFLAFCVFSKVHLLETIKKWWTRMSRKTWMVSESVHQNQNEWWSNQSYYRRGPWWYSSGEDVWLETNRSLVWILLQPIIFMRTWHDNWFGVSKNNGKIAIKVAELPGSMTGLNKHSRGTYNYIRNIVKTQSTRFGGVWKSADKSSRCKLGQKQWKPLGFHNCKLQNRNG